MRSRRLTPRRGDSVVATRFPFLARSFPFSRPPVGQRGRWDRMGGWQTDDPKASPKKMSTFRSF